VIKHLGQDGSKGRVPLCPMSKQNLNPPPIGALKFIKNELKLRKLWPPKIEGVKNSKKTNH